MVYDPRSIIEHCRTLNIGRDLDASLSVEQRADARAIGALVESGLHDVAVRLVCIMGRELWSTM